MPDHSREATTNHEATMFRLALTIGTTQTYGEPTTLERVFDVYRSCLVPCWVEQLVDGRWVAVAA